MAMLHMFRSSFIFSLLSHLTVPPIDFAEAARNLEKRPNEPCLFDTFALDRGPLIINSLFCRLGHGCCADYDGCRADLDRYRAGTADR